MAEGMLYRFCFSNGVPIQNLLSQVMNTVFDGRQSPCHNVFKIERQKEEEEDIEEDLYSINHKNQ